jgi:cation diffusion facilitator family transporter
MDNVHFTMVEQVTNINQNKQAAKLSILSNLALVIMKLTVGIMMHSVSVISEAVHSGIDLVASGIAYISVSISGQPADNDHHFGHGKIENVTGTIEAVLIFVAAFFIFYNAVTKLANGHIEVDKIGIGTVVMGISALSNWIVSSHLLKVAKLTDSVALKADALHLRTDVYASTGVFVGLIAIKLTGFSIIDPLVAIGVAILIIKTAWVLTQSAFKDILDVKLPEVDEALIHEVMAENAFRFKGYHKLRTRKSGQIRYIDLHLLVPKKSTVENGHKLSHMIAAQIEAKLPHSHVLVHIEPCDCSCSDCRMKCEFKE